MRKKRNKQHLKMNHQTSQNGEQLAPFTHTHECLHTHSHLTHTHTLSLFFFFHSVKWILTPESPRTPLPQKHSSWSKILALKKPVSLRLWLSRTKLWLKPSGRGCARSTRKSLPKHGGYVYHVLYWSSWLHWCPWGIGDFELAFFNFAFITY